MSRQLLPVLFHKVFLQGQSSVPSFQSYPSLSRGVLLLGEHDVLLPVIKVGMPYLPQHQIIWYHGSLLGSFPDRRYLDSRACSLHRL